MAGPSVFSELLDILARAQTIPVVLISAFYDESYDNDLLCVAGYLFTKREARLLDHSWRHMLRRYRLPYFRMSACNARKRPFDHLTEQQCIAVATEAIGLINKHATLGFGTAVDQGAFYRIFGKTVFRTPYQFCAWHSLPPVRMWCDEHAPDAKASFFFESGFRHAGQARVMMDRIFEMPNLSKQYRYKSHTFIDKEESGPLQAADLLAWQWYKYASRFRAERTKPRGDLVALTNGTAHYMLSFDEKLLREQLARMERFPRSQLGMSTANMLNAALSDDRTRFKIMPRRPGDHIDFEAHDAAHRLIAERQERVMQSLFTVPKEDK